MKVLKFGGTSMGSVDSLQKVRDVILSVKEEGDFPIVVCSAMSGVTDQLIELGEKAISGKSKAAMELLQEIVERHIATAECFDVDVKERLDPLFQELGNLVRGISMIRELSDRSRAVLTSFGERLSTRLLAAILNKDEAIAEQIDSFFVKTQGISYWEDEVDWEKTRIATQRNLSKLLEKNQIPIITGFFGENPDGVISLLGRGGSDFSGAIIAVSLEISRVEIWTDVSGFLSADPRIVEDAQILEEIGFEEVSELCFFGAKVLHPKTIRPVIDHGGEVWIKNTFESEAIGTRIARETKACNHSVLSISSKPVTLVNLDLVAMPAHLRKSQILHQLFSLLEKYHICSDMVASSETQFSVAFSSNTGQARENFLQDLQQMGKVSVDQNHSVVAIVSPKDVKEKIGVAAAIFQAITNSGTSLKMYSQNMSEIAQLVVVENNRVKEVIAQVHKELVIG